MNVREKAETVFGAFIACFVLGIGAGFTSSHWLLVGPAIGDGILSFLVTFLVLATAIVRDYTRDKED